MKTIGLTSVIFCVVVGNAFAWERPGNPDRYISFGLEVFKGQEAGILKAAETNGGTAGGKLDMRLPVNGNITLNFFGENTGINNNKDFTEGYKLGLGLRVYVKD